MPRRPAALLAIAIAAVSVCAFAQTQADSFAAIEPVVSAAIERHELPGAVILIGQGDRILYERAFGQRAVQPVPEKQISAGRSPLAMQNRSRRVGAPPGRRVVQAGRPIQDW